MAERETKMNLLSPNDRNTVYHADVEYQKVRGRLDCMNLVKHGLMSMHVCTHWLVEQVDESASHLVHDPLLTCA